MKVLKYGTENEKLETMEITCTGKGFEKRGCGALLEITGLDVQSGVYHDYGGGTDTYYCVVCPVCGVKTEIFYNRLPEGIKNFIK